MVRFSKWTPLHIAALASGAAAWLFAFPDAYLLIPAGDEMIGISAWLAGAAWGLLLLVFTMAVVALNVVAPQLIPPAIRRRPAVAPITAVLSTLLAILPAVVGADAGRVGWSAWATWVALAVFTALTMTLTNRGGRAGHEVPGGADSPRR